MKGNTSSPSDERRQGRREALAYGLGGVTSTMPMTLYSGYFSSFLTEFAGMNVTLIGIMSSLSALWDAINDPIIGRMADRTETKRGKYRPWLFPSAFVYGLIILLMFWIPDFGESGRIIYYAVLLFVSSIASTGFMVPWQSLNAVLTQDVNTRNYLLMFRMLFGTLAGTAVGVMLAPIVKAVDGGRMGYFTVAVIVVVTSVICAGITSRGMRRKDTSGAIPTPPKTDFKGTLKVLTSKPVACVAAMLGLVNLATNLLNGTNIYYFTYVVPNLMMITVTSLLSVAAGLIVVPVMPRLYRKIGRDKVLTAGCVLQMLSSLSVIVMRENISTAIIIIGSMLFVAGYTVSNMTIMSFVPDCSDWSELHRGSANAATVSSSVSFMRKVSNSLSGAIVGIGMGLAGYVAGMIPTARLITGIINIRAIIPFVLVALTLVVLKIYPIKGEYEKDMRRELDALRREKSSAAI